MSITGKAKRSMWQLAAGVACEHVLVPHFKKHMNQQGKVHAR